MIAPVLLSRRLVGRDTELRLLNDMRRAASSGRPTVVLIRGEAGIGKTRLLTQFAAGLTGGRAPIYALGECLEDAPRPFGPFRGLLARLVAMERGALDEAPLLVRRALATLVPDTFEPLGTGLPPVQEKAELFAGVLALIQLVAASRTTILALEDIHWADAGSLELLCHIAPRIAGTRAMILATHRDDAVYSDHPLFAPLARLSRTELVRHVSLQPLTDSNIRALIDDALGKQHALDPERIRNIVVRGEGNPFFTEEILKQALEHGPSGTEDALPISIRATILERANRLERNDRDVLDHAAVLGLRFSVEMLARVMKRERRLVELSLRRLRDHQLIVEEPDRLAFRFRHAVTRQTIYDELLVADAHDLHLKIVASLESASGIEEHLDDLAYHAWRAGLGEATTRYSELAGDAALQLRASAQAASYYERAIEAAGDDDTRLRLLGKAAEAYLRQGQFRPVIERSLAQHAMLVTRGDYAAALFAVTRAAGEASNSGKPKDGLAMIQAFGEKHATQLDVAASDHLHASLARFATACDNVALARAELALVRRPDALGPLTHQVYWLAQLVCAEIDVDRVAWRRAAAALRAGNPHATTLLRSQMLHQIATSSTVFGEHDEGESAVDEAIAIDREMGFTIVLAFAQAVKAGILTVRGRLAEARTCIEAALAEPDAFPVRIELAAGSSAAALALGDEALVERLIGDEVLRRIHDAGVGGAFAAVLGMRAAQLFALGRSEDARATLESAIDDEQHQFAAVHMWPFAALHVDDARLRRIRELCGAYLDNPDYRVMHACAAWCDAIAARRSQSADAASLAETAAEHYRALGWPLHEGRALELAGHYDAALALFRACGSVADIRHLETEWLPHAGPRTGIAGLSPREREVATLIARGLSNRAIAAALSVTEKTVEKHVSSVYAKLGFSTRAQLAAYVARAGGSHTA